MHYRAVSWWKESFWNHLHEENGERTYLRVQDTDGLQWWMLLVRRKANEHTCLLNNCAQTPPSHTHSKSLRAYRISPTDLKTRRALKAKRGETFWAMFTLMQRHLYRQMRFNVRAFVFTLLESCVCTHAGHVLQSSVSQTCLSVWVLINTAVQSSRAKAHVPHAELLL